MTGVTGFVGSSLAARLLSKGRRVVALSRNDPAGNRTRSAVQQAAKTLDITLPEPAWNENLAVIPASIEELNSQLGTELLRDVDTVWHLAATLRYNLNGLARSLEVNTRATAQLYRLVAAQCHSCRRFYHFSTAYVAGFPDHDVVISETLHDYPPNANAYQMSKWAAEMTLRNLSLTMRLPITVVRPAIIVGNSRTGVYHGDPFGLYMFFYAGHKVIDLPGVKELRLPPETKGSLSLIPIDILIENVIALEDWDGPNHPFFDVIHCTGDLVPAEMVARAGERAAGVRVTFDAPQTAIDHLFAQAVEENRVFAAHTFRFEQKRLDELLGEAFKRVKFDDAMLERMAVFYLRRLDEERSFLELPATLKPFAPMLSRPSRTLAPRLAKILSKRLNGRNAA